MGTLTCSRCGAHTEANSEKEGRKRLDHSVGLSANKPCEDGRAPLYLTGKIDVTSKPKVQESSKSVGNSNNKQKQKFNHK